jgi:hypothetical protein
MARSSQADAFSGRRRTAIIQITAVIELTVPMAFFKAAIGNQGKVIAPAMPGFDSFDDR